jgi:aminomethyltransferase
LASLTDRFIDLFDYLAPSVVSDPVEEYRAVREAAGLMDFSMLRKVDVTGPGALALLNSILTRDLRRLRTGQIGYGAIADERGKMVDDCTAALFATDKIRFCGANDRDLELFEESAPGYAGVQVRAFTAEMPHLCVQGPASRRILQGVCDKDISNEAFPYYTFRDDVKAAGIPVFMTRLGYTAELGYELWVPADRALELWDALVAAGEPFAMRVIGMDALDLLRIEGGFIIGGVEYDSSVSPYECGLGWAVELDKGAFLGSEALAREKSTIDVRLTSVVLDAGGAGASGARLAVDGVDAGYVTQAISSPYLGGRTLGLAKLRRPHNTAGVKVAATAVDESGAPAGELAGGEVVPHPVYDPERKRAKEKP